MFSPSTNPPMSYTSVQPEDQYPYGLVSVTFISPKSKLKYLQNLCKKHPGTFCALHIALWSIFLMFGLIMCYPTELLPSEKQSGWTSGPTTQGSIDIVWSCFSTIFTCVYVSLHLDISVFASDIQRPGVTAKCKTFWKMIVRKGKWIAFNIIAPELIVQVAIIEYLSAKNGERKIQDPRWTLTHEFFADMGGFRIMTQPPTSSECARVNGADQGHRRVINSG